LAGPRRILVTGSTGNLGQKAVAALKDRDGVEVLRIGRNTGGAPDVVSADLTAYDTTWASCFQNMHAVLHLAADPRPVATWASVQRLNLDLTLNVMRAAEAAQVGRFVFASSNWVLGGYRFTANRLTSATEPRPVNPYGASKLFLERCGLAMAARTGMSFLSLRIGYCQPGENSPGPHMAFGRWGQEMWLSNQDWAQAVCKACLSPYDGSALLNIMSSNAGMRWDLEEAKSVIGYHPTSQHRPHLPLVARVRDGAARLRDWLVPPMSPRPLFGSRW